MSQTNTTGRQRALERRRAMSSGGKAALGNTNPGQGRGRAKPEPVKVERSAARKAAPVARAETQPAAPARRRQTAPVQNTSATRAAALKRRQALSTRGKSAVSGGDRTRTAFEAKAAAQPAPAIHETRKRESCECGCKGQDRQETPRVAANRAATRTRNGNNGKTRKIQMASGRAQSLARRQALSSRGKAGLTGKPMSAAQTARITNPELSGRELAKALREQRSKRGRGAERKAQPTGKIRPKVKARVGAAQDAPWKVGAGETGRGQTVTGTMANRSLKTTGNEAGTCQEVTGAEYLGSDDVRSFCATEAAPRPAKVRATSTFSGNPVTGNETGRDAKVTGNESGTCKRVTGTEYVSAEQEHAYCANAPEPGPAKVTGSQTLRGERITGAQVGVSAKVTGNEPGAGRALTGDQYLEGNHEETASKVTRSGGKGGGKGGQARVVPNKVGHSDTLRGGAVTGTMVGRRERMTGDEPGSCRNVTGDDYVGREQYQEFCAATPVPQDQKVGVSATLQGERITGTRTGRSGRVTGDEPGTCKAVTGTPYAGLEQYAEYCEPRQTTGAQARAERPVRRGGSVMTGIQPGIGGSLTGADKGACETLTGTPYVGADQMAQACPAAPADVNSPDFPQPLDSQTGADAGTESWGDFSVQPPQHAAHEESDFGGVTGMRAAHPGHITGPFGMAEGKVTGTEEARFGRRSAPVAKAVETAPMIDGRVKPRISGEGQDAGVRITGDDWDRNPRVTGTEGASALTRNPTRRGAIGSAMPPRRKRVPEEVPAPVSKITGSSGNTENGSLITYSGGARG